MKIDSKTETLDSKINALDTKVESFHRELSAEIHRVEQVFSTDLVRLEQKVDLRLENMDMKFGVMNDKLATMNEKLDIHRRELLAEIRAALK